MNYSFVTIAQSQMLKNMENRDTQASSQTTKLEKFNTSM
jgi:hypothetical protein